MSRTEHTKYDQKLFEARHTIIESGFYEPLHERIADRLKNEGSDVALKLLDAGCGEGSHLANIMDRINESAPRSLGAGLDIAKEGIMTAAKYHTGPLWCVGDLVQSPFREAVFDVVLNILSPANYDEFKRVLRKGGLLIKVVPQSGYLRELRDVLYPDSAPYSNRHPMERFTSEFEEAEIKHIAYKVPFDASLIPSLIHMTPLAWNQNRIETSKIHLPHVTVDLDVLLARRTSAD